MNPITSLNIALWIVNLCLILGIVLTYFFMTMNYHNLYVPKINTYNDVIDSKTLDSLTYEFQAMFNLKEYEIKFTDDLKPHKLFWNLKRRKKQIIISKRIFESVGYELDYIVSRIWISAKEIQKDPKIRIYKILTKYLPMFLYTILILVFLAQSLLFFYALNQGENIELSKSWIFYLWRVPILAMMIPIIIICLIMDYFIAIKSKEIVEIYYNSEIANLFKIVLEQYAYDFQAARTYANNIKIPILLVFSPKNQKWLGPFVY